MQHNESEKIGNVLVNLKYETLHLSENTKDLKETTNKFSSKLVYQEKHIYSIATYFEARLENMGVNNIFGGNIEAAKF